MDAYDRCTNLGEKILPIVLPSMVEAENFSDHLRIEQSCRNRKLVCCNSNEDLLHEVYWRLFYHGVLSLWCIILCKFGCWGSIWHFYHCIFWD